MPRPIGILLVVLAALQPVTHVLIYFFPPEGMVPTGLHVPDSALFFQSMDMFLNGFHSPYATCQGAYGPQSVVYYNVPHLWLYGALGLLARLLPIAPFFFYGIASGLGMFFYLWVVYRLLRRVVPCLANRAFLLFALGSGPGGVLYVVASLLGLSTHGEFERYFFRFAVYDLMEGPHFNPVLYGPRLYYTLSLGACLGALDALIQRSRQSDSPRLALWLVLLALGTFINARYGVFVGGIAGLWLLVESRLPVAQRLRLALSYAVPAGAGFLAARLLLGINPAVVENHLVVGNMALWFSPFVLVCALPLWAGAPIIGTIARSASHPFTRWASAAALGYLVAYGLGYLLYQGYHGNLLTGRDGSVAAHVSDGALLGALAGLLVGWYRDPCGVRRHGAPIPDWVALWFLLFSAVALSGFGGGWFLQFGPQRLQILLWLPLCILAAAGLDTASPRWRSGITGTMVAFGISSILVSVCAFQAPWGRAQGTGPWPTLHPEVMTHADATLLEALGPGTVLAPAPAGDVVVRQRGNPVVFGIGSFNLTDQPYGELRDVVEVFFDPATTDEKRASLARTWCVDWVLLPDTWPVPPALHGALEEATWLEATARAGTGMLFRIRPPT